MDYMYLQYAYRYCSYSIHVQYYYVNNNIQLRDFLHNKDNVIWARWVRVRVRARVRVRVRVGVAW